MRIAILGGYAPSLVNFRGELIRDMVRAGHEVLAMAPPGDGDVSAPLAELGARYVPAPLRRTGMNPVQDLASLVRLTGIFRSLKPDLVLSYTVKPVVYGSLAARLAGVRRIHSMITGLGYAFGQGGPGRRILSALVRALYRAGLAVNTGVFFQNRDDLELFRTLGLVRPSVPCTLTNGSGVDLDRFSPVPLPDAPSFLCISRLLKEKGVREYVRAAGTLRSRRPGVRCVLVGPHDPGPDSVSVEEVEGWQRDGLVEYLGPAADVRPHIAECSVYVLPSYREGTPRSVLEAMGMGRAVVTTDAVGCRETVEPGVNGFLVPVGDAEALAAAMERFVDQPDLAASMGCEGRRLAGEKFDVRKVNQVILSALEPA